MSLLEWIGFFTGIVGVYLTIKQYISSWPVSLISVIIYTFIFYKVNLLGDMSLQVFYFVSGLYGWATWSKDESLKHFVVKRISVSFIFLCIVITLVQFVGYYYLLLYFKGSSPIFDGILTAASITATIMMAQKLIENWIVWVIIDLLYVILYVQKHLYLTAVLYFIFAALASYGYILWRKEKTLSDGLPL